MRGEEVGGIGMGETGEWVNVCSLCEVLETVCDSFLPAMGC